MLWHKIAIGQLFVQERRAEIHFPFHMEVFDIRMASGPPLPIGLYWHDVPKIPQQRVEDQEDAHSSNSSCDRMTKAQQRKTKRLRLRKSRVTSHICASLDSTSLSSQGLNHAWNAAQLQPLSERCRMRSHKRALGGTCPGSLYLALILSDCNFSREKRERTKYGASISLISSLKATFRVDTKKQKSTIKPIDVEVLSNTREPRCFISRRGNVNPILNRKRVTDFMRFYLHSTISSKA